MRTKEEKCKECVFGTYLFFEDRWECLVNAQNSKRCSFDYRKISNKVKELQK
jgi:hypothetical protein